MTSPARGFPKEVQFPYPRSETSKRPSGNCRLLLRRPEVEDCFCPDHGPTPEISYMRYIRAKDARLYDQVQSIRSAMTSRAVDILDHPCPEIDTKMNAFHVVDYMKRGHSPGCYSPLSPVRVCQAGTPIQPLQVGLTYGKRDPELFPFQPKNRQVIDKNSPLVTTCAPAFFKQWSSPSILGRTEYEDTISQSGTIRMRNTRQYLEPQPSSRLRSGDPNY